MKMSSNSSSNSESVIDLIAMGFNESKARVALVRANGDICKAIELLSFGSEFLSIRLDSVSHSSVRKAYH